MFVRPIQIAGTRLAAHVAVFLCVLPVGELAADVTTVGVVSPVPPAGGGVFSSSTHLLVGTGSNENGTDIWGWLSIDDGTLLQYGQLIVGDDLGYFGQVDVTGDFLAGARTQLNFSASGSTGNPTVQVGNEGTGWLNVGGGSTMTLTNANSNFSLGVDFTGVGYTTVSDQFTILTVPQNVMVGQSGYGTLNVVNGALVRTTSTSRANYVSIGRNAAGVGNVVVDGQGSILRSAGSLRVGEFGQGSLTVSHGGFVDVTLGSTPFSGPQPFVSIGTELTGVGNVVVDGIGSRMQVGDLYVGLLGQGTLTIRNGGMVQLFDPLLESVFVGPWGRIELDGGTLVGSTPVAGFGTAVEGHLGGSGLVRGTVELTETAFLEAHPGDLLRFDGDVSNQGALTIDGGEIRFLAGFDNNVAAPPIPAGRISLENSGTVRFSDPLVNNGVISNAHGTTNIHGVIDNQGTIVVARDTVATFYDTVDNTTGTITVLPGGNALFLADLTFTSAAPAPEIPTAI